jgi:DNA-binding CsgD family transcriptional regulator
VGTPGSWQVLTERIPERFGADLSILALRTPSGRDQGSAFSSGDAEDAQDWLDALSQPEALLHLRQSKREHATFRVDLTSDTMTDAPIRDWASRNALRCAMHGLIWQGEGASGILSIFRRDRQMFDDKEELLFRALLGPLAHGWSIHDQLNRATNEAELGHRVLNTMFVGAVITNSDLTILHSNDMAQELLDEGDAVRSEMGKLGIAPALGPKLANELVRQHELVVSDSSKFPYNATAPLLVPRSIGNPLSIISAPLSEEAYPGPWPQGPPAAVTYFSLPEKFTELAPERLRLAYGLTATEANLAIALALGKSLKQSADESNRSEATLRKHLQSIFTKTETHRQSELVSQLLRRIA